MRSDSSGGTRIPLETSAYIPSTDRSVAGR